MSTCRTRTARTALLTLLSLLLLLPATAHETDQYTLPANREFADLSSYLTARFHGRIEKGVDQLNAQIESAVRSGDRKRLSSLHSPDAVAQAINKQFPIALFLIEELDVLTTSKATWQHYPGRLVGYKPIASSVRKHAEFALNPFRAWGCATIHAFDVTFGTDKVGHFTDMGMHYYRKYRQALGSGKSEEDALREAVKLGTHGLISERGVLGYMTAGAYSNADLVSNYSGMLFYKNLTEPTRLKGQVRPPMLVRDGDYWKLAPHVRPDSDFLSWFVSEHYDESMNPSHYASHLRKGIRKAILPHRDAILQRLADEHGNHRPREYFEQKARELRTYWGVDYGHHGPEDELMTIANTAFPSRPDAGNPHARDASGLTPMHHAAAAGDVELLRRLIEAGGDVNAQVRSNENVSAEWGNRPLHYAARDGRIDTVRFLIDQGADVNAPSDAGATPLHRAIRHERVAAAIIETGADVNLADARGRTALHWCIADPQAQALAVLLERGADPNAQDRDGRTPLHLAAIHGITDSARQLLDRGADAMLADHFGAQPLHLAARHSPAVATALIGEGAVADARDSFGRTPLHEAADAGNPAVVESLLIAGAPVEVPDAYGTTALHLAGRRGHEAVARVLLGYGADVYARADSGRDAIEEADRHGHRTLALLLREGATAEMSSAPTEELQ